MMGSARLNLMVGAGEEPTPSEKEEVAIWD